MVKNNIGGLRSAFSSSTRSGKLYSSDVVSKTTRSGRPYSPDVVLVTSRSTTPKSRNLTTNNVVLSSTPIEEVVSTFLPVSNFVHFNRICMMKLSLLERIDRLGYNYHINQPIYDIYHVFERTNEKFVREEYVPKVVIQNPENLYQGFEFEAVEIVSGKKCFLKFQRIESNTSSQIGQVRDTYYFDVEIRI